MLEEEKEWAWVKARFPEADSYRPRWQNENPLKSLLNWAKPDQTITAYDPQCRPVSLQRSDDRLIGELIQSIEIQGRRKTITSKDIWFDQRITLAGPNEEFWEAPEMPGGPATEGGGGCGCAEYYGPETLAQVTQDAAWYDHEAISLQMKCTMEMEKEMTCLSGKKRTCVDCQNWQVVQASHESHRFAHGLARGKIKLKKPMDCTKPCPSDPPPWLERTKKFLQDHEFLEPLSSHPYLFRTEKSCRDYWKEQGASPEKASSWYSPPPKEKK